MKLNVTVLVSTTLHSRFCNIFCINYLLFKNFCNFQFNFNLYFFPISHFLVIYYCQNILNPLYWDFALQLANLQRINYESIMYGSEIRYKILFIMLRTQYKMLIFLSAQYRTVNYRDNVVEQISRTYSFCTTETFYNCIFKMQCL